MTIQFWDNNDRIWPYDRAFRAFEQAGLPTDVIARMAPRYWGKEEWDASAQATGTVGSLSPAVKRFRQLSPPAHRGRPSIYWLCAGQRDLLDPNTYFVGSFDILVHRDVDIDELLARHGNHERVDDHIRFGEAVFWDLTTDMPRRTVERMIEYLSDPEVANSDPNGLVEPATT